MNRTVYGGGGREVKEVQSEGRGGGKEVEREEVTGWKYRSGSSIDRAEWHGYGGKQGQGVFVGLRVDAREGD